MNEQWFNYINNLIKKESVVPRREKHNVENNLNEMNKLYKILNLVYF